MTVAGATPVTPAAVKAPITSLAITGITLKGGEKLSGVIITLAEGAASLSGRLEGEKACGTDACAFGSSRERCG
jgi:hypothetical protein